MQVLIMKKLFLTIGVLASFSSFAQQKKDQSNQLDDVIIQGNRIQTPFSQATRDIQIVTQQEIEQMPVRSLNEVLSYISGVDIRQRGPFGAQADISIDGGTSEQTLVLLNGVKLIDAQSAHNMMNIPIPLSAIDHIEILRGAAARIYGINALTGAINIVTKTLDHPSLNIDVHSGSSFKNKDEGDGSGIYWGGGAALTGTFGNKKVNHLIAASQNNYNGQRYNSASKASKIFYDGNYNINDNNSIQAMAGYARSHYGANGFYAAPGDVNSAEIVKSSVFSLSSRHKFGKFILAPRISDRYGDDDYRYFKDDLSTARSRHYTNALMLELNSSLETAIGTIGIGWESRFEKISSSNIGKHKRENHGAYAELKSSIGRKLEGSVGLYANYNTDYNWQLYPGLDLAYLIDTHWKISASAGSGERVPSFTDLYLDQRPGNIGNPDIQPESAWNYEGNIQYNKKNFKFQAGYFYRTISDFIDWVRENESEPYAPINFGKNKIQGIYGRIQQSFDLGHKQKFGYHLSYNYLNPIIDRSSDLQSKYALESLKHQFIAGINYGIGKFSCQLENRLLKRELADGYDVADFRANYQINKVTLYSSINNIFDAQYTEAGAVPMPTRWFALGAKFKLQ